MGTAKTTRTRGARRKRRTERKKKGTNVKKRGAKVKFKTTFCFSHFPTNT